MKIIYLTVPKNSSTISVSDCKQSVLNDVKKVISILRKRDCTSDDCTLYIVVFHPKRLRRLIKN